MLIKLLFVVGLIFFVGRNLLKLAETPTTKNNAKPKNNDDAIDADYTVIDDDK